MTRLRREDAVRAEMWQGQQELLDAAVARADDRLRHLFSREQASAIELYVQAKAAAILHADRSIIREA